MILVADSGSTRTVWILTDGNRREGFTTQGLNPYHTPPEEIRRTVAQELLPQTGTAVTELYFYGSGCTPAKTGEIAGIFSDLFPSAYVEVGSDLLGACRGLCGGGQGIVCILGTGSNSCLYDGVNIVVNTPPLGYILGDEGSGSALGGAFVSDCLKNLLPAALKDEFLAEYGLTQDDILERVYRRPFANRFLAGFAPFISSHRHVPEVRALVMRAFRDFLRRNVLQYGAADMKINFTGSIAWYFSDLLTAAVGEEGLTPGIITQSPIEGIAKYHTQP